MSLHERIRPGVEAAPWVCDEIKKLEERLAELERASSQSKVVPEGFQLVPTEPTIEMIAALGFGGDVALAMGHGAVCQELENTYRALLAATPFSMMEQRLAELESAALQNTQYGRPVVNEPT